MGKQKATAKPEQEMEKVDLKPEPEMVDPKPVI